MFTKWELMQSGKTMFEDSFDIAWGVKTTRQVFCDVYRKKRFNGTYKYKYVKVLEGQIIRRTALSY